MATCFNPHTRSRFTDELDERLYTIEEACQNLKLDSNVRKFDKSSSCFARKIMSARQHPSRVRSVDHNPFYAVLYASNSFHKL